MKQAEKQRKDEENKLKKEQVKEKATKADLLGGMETTVEQVIKLGVGIGSALATPYAKLV